VRESKTSFVVMHYPGRVTYDAIGFLEKNKDPLSQDAKVLMQYSDDEFVVGLFTDKVKPGGRAQFKSAKFVGVIDSFRTSLAELVETLKKTKTHFIRWCVRRRHHLATTHTAHPRTVVRRARCSVRELFS
jgi:myosin-5